MDKSKEKVLFEIPVYSMTKFEFNRRWDDKKAYLYDLFINGGHTHESALYEVRRISFPRDQWKYNNIIGYIVLSVSNDDIWIEVYKSLSNRFYACANTKRYIQSLCVNGYHFCAGNMDDNQIHENIEEIINEVENKFFKKTMYVDRSVFETVFYNLNIKHIIDNL